MTSSRCTTLVSIGLLLGAVSLVSGNVPLKCHTCEGIGCRRTSLATTQKCIDPLDICITVYDKYDVVRKGCSMQIPESLRSRCDKPDDLRCHKCNENLCNNVGRKDYLCVECDSSENLDCARAPASIQPTRCAAPSAPNAYCYVRVSNGVTQRGCSTAVKEQMDCLNSSSCMLCMPGDVRGCNSVNFTPGTARAFFV